MRVGYARSWLLTALICRSSTHRFTAQASGRCCSLSAWLQPLGRAGWSPGCGSTHQMPPWVMNGDQKNFKEQQKSRFPDVTYEPKWFHEQSLGRFPAPACPHRFLRLPTRWMYLHGHVHVLPLAPPNTAFE